MKELILVPRCGMGFFSIFMIQYIVVGNMPLQLGYLDKSGLKPWELAMVIGVIIARADIYNIRFDIFTANTVLGFGYCYALNPILPEILDVIEHSKYAGRYNKDLLNKKISSC